MSDKNYDIDDILKEVDSLRENSGDDEEKDRRLRESVTEIIGGNELDRLLYAGSQKKSPRAGKQKKRETPVFEYDDKQEDLSARQLTEDEYNARLSGDISKAAENVRQNRERFDEPEEQAPFSARQLTEEESVSRIAGDVSKAADVKIYEKNKLAPFDPETADTAEIENFSEHVRPFEKPEVSGADDDIIFHTRGDLVTTETMEMRKQQKINDINEALLKADSEAQSPEEMLDLINPMESRAKVEDMLRSDVDPDTDTLAVAGNDLKRIAHSGERVKEYQPAASKRREDDVLFVPTGRQTAPIVGELHVGETIVDALNKKIAEENGQKLSDFKPEADGQVFEDTSSGKISVIASAYEEQSEEAAENNEKVAKIKVASELARKRKRKIADFILESSGEDDEEEELAALADEPEDEDEDTEEAIDLDDENVIRDRLSRATKGLISRLIILGVLFSITLFVAIVNALNLNIGSINSVISLRSAPENYLYTHLVIGILSFAACSSVITNGFSRFIKLRPDGDTLCAFAHSAAIVSLVPYLLSCEFIQRGRSHVYLLVSLALLCFNTVSKLITVITAKKNFEFTSRAGAKYFVERCEKDGAEQLAKGAVMGIPSVASMRKTEMLYDFIVSTYCEDASDRVSGKTSAAALIASLISGIVAFFICEGDGLNKLSWAVTNFSAVLCLGAAFSCSMIVTLPLLMTAIKGKAEKFAVLGFGAAEEYSETNAVLVEAKTIFPPDTIKINNICGYDKPKSRCEGKINIDEAIIYAASLAVASDSVMSDVFFNMLGYKQELLKPVAGCVYENNLGVMGWIDRRRVLLGTRAHMKSHEISVPNMKKEMAANIHNDEVIYLAVGGEVCLLFFVEIGANASVKAGVERLSKRGISFIVKTVDGMITSSLISQLFGIDENTVKVIPFESFESFSEHTKFVSRGSAALSCGGTFSSFAGAVNAAKSLRTRVSIGCILQIVGVGLGVLLSFIFMLFSNYAMLSELNVLLFNLICAAVTLGAQFCGGFIEKILDKKKLEEKQEAAKE